MNNYNLLCIIYACFGAVFYGYDSGCTTSILGYEAFLEYFSLDSVTIGAFGSAYYGGSVVGMGLNWWLPNAIGRRQTIRIACVIGLLGGAMQTGAHSFPVFCTGRIIGGVACGIIFSLCPAYAAEISPPAIRGYVGGLYSFNVNAAYMLTEWIGLGFYFVGGNVSWRLLLGLQLIPPVLMFTGSFFIPESPRWLALKGRYEECLAVLKRIHQTDELDDEFYLKEYHQIRAQVELDRAEQLGLAAIWKRPSYRKRFLLVALFAVACQLTGIIPIQNYQVILYGDLGITHVMSLVITGIWGCVGSLSALYAAFCFEKVGRRKTIFIAYTFILIGSLCTVIMWAQFEAGGSKDAALGRGVIAGMFLVSCGYGGPCNAFISMYAAEIMPNAIRTVGCAVSYMALHLMIIVLVQVTPLAVEAISWRYFLIFLICSSIFAVMFYFLYPETQGKTLEDIEAIFGDKIAESFDQAGEKIRKGGNSGELKDEKDVLHEEKSLGEA